MRGTNLNSKGLKIVNIPIIRIIVIVSLCFAGCADKVAPDVMLTSPRTGADLRDVVTVTVDASDDEKLKKVELYINGILHESSSSSKDIHTFSWNTDVGDNGNYSLYAKAYDEAGNNTVSDMIDVTVTNYRTFTLVNQSLTWISYEFGNHSGWIGPRNNTEGEDTVKVEMEKNSGSTIFSAKTSGHNTCGYELVWYKEHDVEDQEQTWYHWVNDKYYLVYILNELDYTIDRIVVNKDASKEKTCYSDIIKNNPDWNIMGYYDAIDNPSLYLYLVDHPDYDYYYYLDFPYNSASDDDNNLYQAFAPEEIISLLSGSKNQDFESKKKKNSLREVVKGGVVSEKPLEFMDNTSPPVIINRDK